MSEFGEPTITHEAPDPFRDALTGLHNRAFFDRELGKLISSQSGEFGLILFDLDGLKPINDKHGHAAGDKFLQDTADIMTSGIRHEKKDRLPDSVFLVRAEDEEEYRPADSISLVRLGGDEFAILFPGMHSQENLDAVAERIREKLAEKDIETSLGALIHQAGEGASALTHNTDRLLYEDKRARKEERLRDLPRRKQAAHHLSILLRRYAGTDDGRN